MDCIKNRMNTVVFADSLAMPALFACPRATIEQQCTGHDAKAEHYADEQQNQGDERVAADTYRAAGTAQLAGARRDPRGRVLA